MVSHGASAGQDCTLPGLLSLSKIAFYLGQFAQPPRALGDAAS